MVKVKKLTEKADPYDNMTLVGARATSGEILAIALAGKDIEVVFGGISMTYKRKVWERFMTDALVLMEGR